jgi:hypothetical protein
MRPLIRRRRAHVLAATALLATAGLVAGCSSTGGTNDGSSPLPGISADKVKIGYAILDSGELSTTLGFVQPEYGDVAQQQKAVEAVVKYVNDNGGMGGRQVELVVKSYPALTDNPSNSLAQCNAFTQDQKVFAVVLDGALQNNAIPCYAQANTLVLDQTLIAHDTEQLEKQAPYLWSVTHPEYGGFLKAQLAAMNEAGYFEGNSGVLIMAGDDEVGRRSVSSIVEPYLNSIKVNKRTINYIDSSTQGSLGRTINLALTAGISAKANRVLTVGGARIVPVALADPLLKNYVARWSMSTFDNPSFVERNPEQLNGALRAGMIGLGYAPATDVEQSVAPPWPNPAQPYQQKCYDIINGANAGPPVNLRVNWKNALQYCDGAMFLKAVLDNLPGAGEVSGNDFKEAAGKIGSTYQSSLTFGSSWGPGQFAGTNTGQVLAWDDAAGKFGYTSGPTPFGPVAAATTPTAPSSVAGTPSGAVSPPVTPTTPVAPTAPLTSAPVTPSTPGTSSAPGGTPPTGGVVTPGDAWPDPPA